MEALFAELAGEDHLTRYADPERFAARAAHYIAEINAIHPFREGNGRCQLNLLHVLMEASGFGMDEDRIDPEGFMRAMVASFHGDNGPLTRAVLAMMAG